MRSPRCQALACGRSTWALESMRTGTLAFLALWSGGALGNALVVTATVHPLPGSHFAVLKEPGCNETDQSGNLLLCIGGWSRYDLANVFDLHGRHLPNTITLIYSDPLLGGSMLLELESLSAQDSKRYGATYKAVSMGPLYKTACLGNELQSTSDTTLHGPIAIPGFGDKCYMIGVDTRR